MPGGSGLGGTGSGGTGLGGTGSGGSGLGGTAAHRRQLANTAWEALLAAHAALIREFAAQDVWRELAMREYDVLYTLSKCPEPVRLGELNRHVLLSQPALSRLVDRLVARGFVERKPDPADRRGVLLRLTDAGLARQRDVGRAHARSVTRAVASRLSREELAQLTDVCRKLAEPDPIEEALR
jgi:DNA-binding MarR family transcriptional regulator